MNVSPFGTPAVAPGSTAVCVLGMHRSGTSALTGLFHHLGMYVGNDLMPIGPDNPKGFWEHGHIVSANVGLLDVLGSYFADFCPLREGWERTEDALWYRDYIYENVFLKEFAGKPLWGFKDPRVCRLLPLWQLILDRMKVARKFVLMTRHPDEVIASLMHRNPLNANQCMLIWLDHMLEAEFQTRGHSRVVVDFDQVFSNWRQVGLRVEVQLGIQWPSFTPASAQSIDAFLDPSLRHHRGPGGAAAVADRRISAWAYSVHEALLAMAQDRATPVDVATIDRIRREFLMSVPALMSLRPPRPRNQAVTTQYTNAEKMLHRAG